MPIVIFSFKPPLFHEHEIYGEDKAAESGKMIPVQGFAVEENGYERRKHRKRDNLLYYF